MAIRFTVTDAGRAALINQDNTGTGARKVTEIGLGRGQYEVGDTSREALSDPIKRIDTIAGQAVADDVIHVTLQDETADIYSVGEIGLFLDNGVLLAYHSQPDGWVVEKAEPATLLLAADITVQNLDVTSLEFGDAAFLNPPASETVKGVIELADETEALNGEDLARAMTPKRVNQLLKRGGVQSGSGLTGGGDLTKNRTLSVDGTVVRTSRQVTAGSGLAGGGNFSQNRTLYVPNGGIKPQHVDPRSLGDAQLTAGAIMLRALNAELYANQATAQSGSNNTQLMTPKRVRQAFQQYGLGPNSVYVSGGEDMLALPSNNMFIKTSGSNNPANYPAGAHNWSNAIHLSNGGSNEAILLLDSNGDAFLIASSGGTFTVWRRFWHDRNMGPGSGMNADLVDGLHASQFLRADATNNSVPLDNKEWDSISADGELFWDKSSGVYIKSSNAKHTRAALMWTSANFTAGDNLAVSYDNEDHPTLRVKQGPGSSLNADTVDGKHADSFMRSDKATQFNVGRGIVHVESHADDNQNGAGITLRTSSNPNDGSPESTGAIFAIRSSGDALRLWVGQSVTSTGDNDLETKQITAQGSIYAQGNREVWHPGNQGPGSGMNADRVDGLDSHQFMRSDTGNQVLKLNNREADFNASDGDVIFDASQGLYVRAGGDWHVLFSTKCVNGGNGINISGGTGKDAGVTISIKAGGITDREMSNGSVGQYHVKNGAIKTRHIGQNAVSSGQLQNAKGEDDWVRYRISNGNSGQTGTYAFLECLKQTSPGQTRSAKELRWSNNNNGGGSHGYGYGENLSGTWKCMGWVRGGNSDGDDVTTWLRIN